MLLQETDYQTGAYGDDYQQKTKSNRWILFLVAIIILAASFVILSPLSGGPKELSGSIDKQISDAISKDGQYKLNLDAKDACYWIKPGHDGENYLVEIMKINASQSCLGDIVSKETVISDYPVNYAGGCVCGSGCRIETKKETDGVLTLKLVSCEKL